MNWMDLLRQAVKKQGQAGVAKELSVSRATVNMVLKGTYNADTKNIERKVLSSYGQTVCPFLGLVLDGPQCRWYRERSVPMSHHREIEHWQACRTCEAPIVPDASDPDTNEKE